MSAEILTLHFDINKLTLQRHTWTVDTYLIFQNISKGDERQLYWLSNHTKYRIFADFFGKSFEKKKERSDIVNNAFDL